MKWILHRILNQSHYWTLSEQQPKAELRYNGEARSMQLNAGDRRLFFLERSGNFLHSRMRLRTEYSVIVGESDLPRNRRSGQLVLNGRKLSYRVRDNWLRLFNRNKQ